MNDPERLLAWTLGELEGDEARQTEAAVQSDPALSLEAAELRSLLEEMRTVKVEPSGRVPLAVRYAVTRRERLLRARQAAAVRRRKAWRQAARVAGMAAVMLFGLVLWQDGRRAERRAVRDSEVAAIERALPVYRTMEVSAPPVSLPSPRAEDVLALGGDSLQRQFAPLEKYAEVDAFTRLARAKYDLAMLRLEFTQRYSPNARRESIARCGGHPILEDRIQAIARTVADSLLRRLEIDELSTEETALAVRALLASGSTRRMGHRKAVDGALDYLERRLPQLKGGELASALAAVTDYAVVSSGRAADLVAEHAARLARSTLEPVSVRRAHSDADLEEAADRRPELLRFQTSVAGLADAGQVLRLAPAFGVRPDLARDARLLVAAHVKERLADAAGERPDLLAALLYGFGDLIDREEIDRRLVLWRPVLLAGQDHVALHHLAWSQFPLRPGWAHFQRELRALAALETPPALRDAAALLLSLAMNYAAPGVREVLHLAG